MSPANRQHFREIATTVAANIIISAIGSLGGILLARFLGPTQRGNLAIILQWPAMVGSLASLGITQSTCYFVSKMRNISRNIVATAAMCALVTGLVVALIGPFISFGIGRDKEVIYLLIFVFLLSPIYISGGVWQSALQSIRITTWNVARLIQPTLYLLCIMIFWTLGRLTLLEVVSSFAISLIFQTVFSFWSTRETIGKRGRVQRGLIKKLYGYGIKVWFSSVPRLVNVSLDQLMLSVWPGITSAELGNYVVAVSLSMLVLPISQAFGSVAFPKIAKESNNKSNIPTERITLLGATISSLLVITPICSLASTIVPIVFGKGYEAAVTALWILSPGAVFLAITQVLGDILKGKGRPLIISTGEGIGSICTIVLLIVLIPNFGINGAAVASTIAYGIVMVFLLIKNRLLNKLLREKDADEQPKI